MLAALANARGLAAGVAALRPQDVFATSLYTGNNTARSITTGLDMVGSGGLVWTKARSGENDNALVDTVRGRGSVLFTNSTSAQGASGGTSDLTAFLSNGYSLGATASTFTGNQSGTTYASWSFRRAPKFFDIVTYTGDGTSGRVIPHALGIKPGMIIVKARSSAFSWPVYHRSLGANNLLFLNLTDAATASALIPAEPTDTGFVVGIGGGNATNQNGVTYVAYLFAHDPDTTNGIVQCGGYTTDANGNATINLGWQPQWLLSKVSSAVSGWSIRDAARGLDTNPVPILLPDSSAAETTGTTTVRTSTGFTVTGTTANISLVYLAIRAPT